MLASFSEGVVEKHFGSVETPCRGGRFPCFDGEVYGGPGGILCCNAEFLSDVADFRRSIVGSSDRWWKFRCPYVETSRPDGLLPVRKKNSSEPPGSFHDTPGSVDGLRTTRFWRNGLPALVAAFLTKRGDR